MLPSLYLLWQVPCNRGVGQSAGEAAEPMAMLSGRCHGVRRLTDNPAATALNWLLTKTERPPGEGLAARRACDRQDRHSDNGGE